MNLEFLKSDIQNIFSFLENIFQDGGKSFYSIKESISPVKFNNGMSGFKYGNGEQQGELLVGLILGGTGFSLKRIVTNKNEIIERNDYFNLKGELTFTSDKEALKSIIVDFHEMDLSCPILNHFYNFLSIEYKNASEGRSQTKIVHSVENFLRKIYKSKKINLSIKNKEKDIAIQSVYKKIKTIEMDPVLSWEERQIVFNNLKKDLKIILNTKIRAHKLNRIHFKFKILKNNFYNFIERIKARPVNNLKGLLYRYTVGKIIWFFQTVKNNLGYSVALAVYGPFTYYFITMPMNPHAMQAVGKVRTAYLETKNTILGFLENSEITLNELKEKKAIAQETPSTSLPSVIKDTVTTKASSQVNENTNDLIMANIIYPSDITTNHRSRKQMIMIGNGGSLSGEASLLNMLLTTDLDEVNKISWIERMSNFKQMQIGYEENIEFASRMGRLEQLETQYNFPLQIEAAWEELERYNNLIFKIRQENPNLSAKMKQYLFNEINRTQQLELYLWDRMGRFILDQIYVMLDQDKEQNRNDYYVGRSFVFMEEMTNILSWRYKDFKKHEGYERIENLAKFYKSNRKEMGTVLKNLTANSTLFKQKNIYDTNEFRSYMKRQWEILYLQNSKAEEAANMGLNMYIWSVRNTVWILQSLYSAKREEISLLIKKDNGNILSQDDLIARSKISMMYETLIHNLTLEYVGIREEIMKRIGKDIESNQRMTVINNLREFLSDREKLDNLAEIGPKTAGTK